MTRRTGRALLGVAIALAVTGFVIVVTQSRPARLAADFTIDYSAGRLLGEGDLGAPYRQADLAATMRAVAPDGAIDPRLPFNKPLAAALPYVPLSLLPIEVAFRFWQAVSVAIILGSIVLLQRLRPLGAQAPIMAVIGAGAAVPSWAALTEGQVTPLLLAGAILAVSSAISRRPWPAVLAGALLAVKPQYLPAYLLFLLAVRHWKALAAATAGGALMLLSPLAGGPATLGAMAHNALLANHVVDPRLNEAWVGVAAAILPAGIVAPAGLAFFAAALIALAWVAWGRALPPVAFAVLAGLLAVLASPHTLPHDLLILGVPAWLSIGLNEPRRQQAIAAWLLIDLALVIDLRGIGLPLAPIVLTLLLGWRLWRLRQRAQPAQHQPPVALAG